MPPVEIIPHPIVETEPVISGGKPDELKSLKTLKGEAAEYIEKKAIRHALKVTGWNKRHAAKMLKISYKTLFYKMDHLGIKRSKNVAQGSSQWA